MGSPHDFLLHPATAMAITSIMKRAIIWGIRTVTAFTTTEAITPGTQRTKNLERRCGGNRPRRINKADDWRRRA